MLIMIRAIIGNYVIVLNKKASGIMDLIKYFKEIHQFQFGFVQNNLVNKKDELMIFESLDKEVFNKNEDEVIEIYPKISLEDANDLNTFFAEVSLNVYADYKCTHLQLLVNEEFNGFKRGSYWINYPKALNTGCYEDEVDNFFKMNIYATLIICADVQKISILGRNGFAQALKQAGEIRQVLKCAFEGKVEVRELVNVNALAHAAGININQLMILDVIVFLK